MYPKFTFKPTPQQQRQTLLDYYACIAEGKVFVRSEDIVWLAQARGLRADARILDIGCGQGQVGIALARAFPEAHVVGLDVSPEQIERANRAARVSATSNVEFVLNDWSTFQLPSDGVDLIIATQVVQFLDDEISFMEYMAAGLAAGGMLVLRTILLPEDEPGRSFVQHVFLQSIPGAVRFYSERDLLELMREVGLTRLRIDKEEIVLDRLPPEQAQALHYALQREQMLVDNAQAWFWSGTISAVRP